MMDLESAIRHCEEVARQNEEDAILYSNCKKYKKNLYEIGLAENAEKKCSECADDHRQLVEWLKELKAYKEQGGDVSRSEIPNTCSDAISRQAVLKIIDGWYDNNRDTENIEDLIILITYMSSVSPQQRTGRWRKVSMDKYIQHATYYYECSECGDQHIGQVNYCPNCGARMEVEEC